MASPIGHSLAGMTVSLFWNSKNRGDLLFQISLTIVMANLPDFDFLPGIIFNMPALFHGEWLHSIVAAAGISLLAASGFCLIGRPFRSTFVLAFLAYTTHLGLDLVRPDGRPPIGIPLFWPWIERYYISPVPLLMPIQHVGSTSASTIEFIRGIMDIHNLKAILLEIAILAPIVFLVSFFRKWQRERAERSISDSSTYQHGTELHT